MIYIGYVAVILSGCVAAVAPDGEIASTEKTETANATCPYLRTQQASCEELKRSYDEGFRAGKEIIAAVSDHVGIESTLRLEASHDKRGRSACTRGQWHDDSGAQGTGNRETRILGDDGKYPPIQMSQRCSGMDQGIIADAFCKSFSPLRLLLLCGNCSSTSVVLTHSRDPNLASQG
jgi:hypothetical protein